MVRDTDYHETLRYSLFRCGTYDEKVTPHLLQQVSIGEGGKDNFKSSYFDDLIHSFGIEKYYCIPSTIAAAISLSRKHVAIETLSVFLHHCPHNGGDDRCVPFFYHTAEDKK